VRLDEYGQWGLRKEVVSSYYSITLCNFDAAVLHLGTAVAQLLRCCATNRKVAGSISAGVSGFFIDINSLRSHYYNIYLVQLGCYPVTVVILHVNKI